MATKKTGYRAFRTLTAERKANIDLLLKALGRGEKGLCSTNFYRLVDGASTLSNKIEISPDGHKGEITLSREDLGLTNEGVNIIDGILYKGNRPGCTRKFKGSNFEAAALWITHALHTAENEQARKAVRKAATVLPA